MIFTRPQLAQDALAHSAVDRPSGASPAVAVAEPDAPLDTVRVFLCDDVPEFRALMRFALEEDEALEIVGEAGDGVAGVEGIRATQPDVVLLDLSMPTCDGLQAIPRIQSTAPGCAIIVLSGLRAEPIARTAFQRGATAYIEKGESFAGIRRKVRDVASAPPSAA